MTTEQALIAAVITLAGVIVFLFTYYSGRLEQGEKQRSKLQDDIAQERISWAVERTRWESADVEIRAQYEEKHRALLEQQAHRMQAIYDAAREHENRARKEFTENMEIVASKVESLADKLGAVLEKLLDRALGTRSTTTPRKG